LKHIPFVVPFETRVNVFREFVARDKSNLGFSNEWMNPLARVTIRRASVFEDGFAHLNALGPGLKRKVAITFVNEQGLVEAGIDGGGVFKEFLNALAQSAFDVNYGLFLVNNEYEGILLDVSFADFFLAKWLRRQSYLDDLKSLDASLYQGLLFLKNYEGNVEDLALTFTVSEQEFGKTRDVALVPNGESVAVTNENRIKYIYLVANYKLNTQISKQCNAFFRGLSDVITPGWLDMFSPPELQVLLSGSTANTIDIDDFEMNVVYGGKFSAQHPTIQMFWRVVRKMGVQEQRNLVRFITSCSRPPLLGFKELNPNLCIRDAGDEEDRLPTASTCVNLLKLPVYKHEKALKEKLLYAINSSSGFELS
jgi:ubiquitin-protein ligase E3 C